MSINKLFNSNLIFMETKEVAQKLYELCAEGKYEQAQKELFASHVKSIEPAHVPGPQVVEGLDGLAKKGEVFQSMIEETHSGYVNEPKVYGDFFSMEMGMDVTMKEAGRVKMDELAVYQVEDGKIVSEQFFY